MDINKSDYENTAFQDFERIVIYDIQDGSSEILIKSLNRLHDILAELPSDRDTRAIWLYDKQPSGPRLGMLYWVLWDDEKPSPDTKPVTRDVNTSTRQYDDLTIISVRCVTDVPNGSLRTLLKEAIKELSSLEIKKLEDISFSKVSIDDFMEEVVLKLYCR